MTLSCFVTRNLRTSIFLSPTVKHTLDGHTPQICQKTEFFLNYFKHTYSGIEETIS